MKQKLLQFDCKKWLKLLKTNFGCNDNDVNPYIFVFVDNVTTKLVRSASALLLNVNNCKKSDNLSKHAKTGTISKIPKKTPKMHCCQHKSKLPKSSMTRKCFKPVTILRPQKLIFERIKAFIFKHLFKGESWKCDLSTSACHGNNLSDITLKCMSSSPL